MDSKTLKTLKAIAAEEINEMTIMLCNEPVQLQSPSELRKLQILTSNLEPMETAVRQVRACLSWDLSDDEVFQLMQKDNYFGVRDGEESQLKPAIETLWGFSVSDDEALEAGKDPEADVNFTQPGASGSESENS